MGTFYRAKIETQNECGETIKFYSFDHSLFSIVNKKHQKALLAAKKSGAAYIVASIDRMNNGCAINVSYFIRENTALSANYVSDNAQNNVSSA